MAENSAPDQQQSSELVQQQQLLLRQQLDELKKTASNLTGNLCDLDKNDKRWLLIGVILHTILAPVLRKYVAESLNQLYETLKKSSSIDCQRNPNQLRSYLSTFLNYEAINNNEALGLKLQNKFDYCVKNPVDLSKLFLKTHMAHYNNFDESCDSFALLEIIIGTCSSSGRDSAKKVKDEIRNPWAHFDFTKWDETKYTESFKLMKELVESLRQQNQEEITDQLEKWKQNGIKFIEGSTPELVVLEEIQKQIQAVLNCIEVIAFDTPAEIPKLKGKLTEATQILSDHTKRIKQLEEKFQHIQASIRRQDERIDELDDAVPRNMKENYQVHIKEWMKEEKTFTITRATKYVTSLIKKNNIVVVAGSSGCGKSSIIHHIALELQTKEGYDIIPFINCPSDIIRYRDLKKNQVFVIDDICGKNFINEQDLQLWKKQIDKIEKLFPSEPINKQDSENVTKEENRGILKILVSCRLQIFKDEKFKSLEIFTKQGVDLQSEEHCLLLEEKHKMIKKYIAKPESDLQEMDEMFEKYSYFPLLCKMSKGKQVKQLTELFSSPVESIKNDIKDMIEYKHFEFCALVLCVLFPNELDERYINPRTAPQDVKEKVTEIVANFRIDLKIEPERKQLVDTFNRLDGTYIKKTGSVYSIAHDKLYDMVAVTCGQKLVELFIEYSPSSFIAERFRLLSGQNLEQDDSFLYLSDDIENVYFDRIFRDLKEQDGKSFFYNQQLKEKRYKDKVMGYIKEHTDSCKQVFLELDDKGVKYKDDNISTHRPIRRHYYTSTPMIEASRIGFYELVKYLISIKCNVNKTDSSGLSPLWYCCYYGHVNIVELLITNGGNIQEALCYACWNGDINIVRMFLKRNVDVSQRGGVWGLTPLFTACSRGHTDIVRLLLQSNADPRQRGGRWGYTPLDAARNNETIKNLLKSYIKD